jgi:hypothetical protein
VKKAVVSQPPMRLAELIRLKNGLSVAQAVEAAQQNLSAIRLGALEGMAELIGQMKAVAGRADISVDERTAELYRLSNELFGVAGALEIHHLSKAAYSFCEALDRMASTGVWHEPIVAVHIAALSRLRRADGDEALCAKITDGLQRVARLH